VPSRYELANWGNPGNQDRDFNERAHLTWPGELDHAVGETAFVAVDSNGRLLLRTTRHAVRYLHGILVGGGRRHGRSEGRRRSRHQRRSRSNHDPHRNPQRQKPAHDSSKFHGRKIPRTGRIEKPRDPEFGDGRRSVTSRPREGRRVRCTVAIDGKSRRALLVVQRITANSASQM
jgi:hypothetical protein